MTPAVKPEEMHIWYLEITTRLKKESFNANAQVPYSQLTKEQQAIDKFIADRCNMKFNFYLRHLRDEFTDMVAEFACGCSTNYIIERLGKMNNKLNEVLDDSEEKL
ncbi:MAG: hypothetical protein DRR04_12090 [Gammaproteobacteria bacterium]|nr:MAG: hypothetical protein DRR04_12090 [Gammaproteobacteria bacterium]